MSSKKPPGGFNKKFANSSERKPDNEKSKSKKEAYNQKNYKSSPALSASTCGKSPLLQFTAKAADDSKTTHDAKTTDDQKFSKNSKKPDQERGFANYTSSRGNNQDTKNLHAQARSSNPCTKNPVRNEGDRKCRPSAPDIMSPMAMALEHEIQRGVGIKHHVHYEKKNRSYQDHQHNFSQSHAKPMAMQEIQRGVGIKHHSIRSNQDPQHNFSQSRAKPMALEEINRVVSAKHHAEKSNTNIQNNFPQTGTKPKTPQNTTGNCYFSKPFNQNKFSQPQKNFGPRNFQNYGRFQGPKQIIPNQNSPFDFMQKSLNFLSDNLQNSFGVSAENASFSKKNAVPNVRYRKKTSTCNNQNSSQGNVTKDFSNKKKRSRKHANNFRKKEFQTKQPDTSNVAPLLSFQREVEEAVKSFDLMEFSDAEDDWCTVSQSSVDTANLIDFSDDFSDDFVHVPKPSVKIDDLLSISDAFVSQPPLLNSTSEIFSDGDDSDSTEESEQSGLTSEFSVDSSVLDSETKLNCLESNVTMKEAFVSVFWDIENCALPLKKSAVDFASYVRDNFYDGRTEVTFTAACDVSKLNFLLVRDLDEAAITLIHISSLNKNAADKKIMGFLQKFQVQYRKSNSAVVLISSDSDFADILVTMRYQHHIFVNVICKSNTRNALTASANKNVLFEDILNEIPDRDAKNNAQHIIIVKNLPKMKINSIKNILSEKLKSFNHRLKFVEESVAKIIFKDHSVCNKAMNSLKGLYIGGNVLDISYHKEQEQSEILEKKARKKKVLQNEKEKIVSENIGLDSQLCKGETTSKSATLCVCVSIYLGDTGYWKAEFEKMWNMTGFSISWDYNTFGGCFLINFESLKKAQKAKKIIQKTQMNDSSAPKFLKLIRQEEDFGNLKWDIMSNFEQTQKKKVEEYIQIIEKKKIKFLKKHETVMSEILRQASCPVKGATEAVSDKLRECKEQMETFKNFSNVTINSIKGLSNNTENLEEKLQEYLCDFTRECNCLASALPIYSKKENILKKVKEHQVIVIRAETGSGKSTQLAQYMWRERNNYKKGMVICTQPRKVAAISLAKHVSSLIGSSLGDIVGYQVGMVSKMSAKTRILYVTDFTMLKILISEDLNDVSCVIIDEAHERTIYTDILLGMVKQYLPMHPNLKLLITSATIDTSIFRDFFSLTDDAVLHISGRTFPVEDIWLNCDVTPDSDYLNKAIDKVLEILSKDPGDVLSFLTTPLETEKAIETLSEKLKGLSGGKNVKVFCLHGKMNSEEQQKVFEKTPTGMRKVVFATNCAETSITIPGIKYVIDCGLVKESKYDAVRNMNILSIGFVSKSSAEQRRGRAGRTQVGTCYHLYSKKNYDSMESSTIPEILRINLGQALLKLLKMGIQNPVQFDFIQSPPKELLSSAMDQLVFLKAVDEDFALTDLGMKMAVLPLEPRLCHLIFQGFKNNIGYDILVTAALVTMSQNIFFRNSENKKEADAKKRRFCEYENDFISYLEVYKEWVDVPKNLKSQWCVSNCINARSMRTVHDLVNEIILTLQKELNLKIKHKFNAEASYETLTKIIFRSFAQNLSVFSGHPKFGYKSLNVSDQLLIHPSSSLSAFERLTPQYVVYDTILKTSRAFIVNVCPVSRDMILNSDIYIDLDSFDNLIGSEFPVSPLGAKILVAHFIGKKGMKRKDLQSKIKELIRSDYVEIDIDVSKGCVRFFCLDQDIEKIESLVFPIIHDARQSLLNEERDVALSEDREFIAVLTSGGCIKDVVLPGEFRDIKVILKGQEDIRSVCEKLSSCGTITDIREWKNYFKVTFSTPASARNALDMYSNETDFSLRSIHKYAFMNEREYLYKVVMSFFRRPGMGLAYVTVEPKVSVFSLPKYAKYLDLLSVKVHVNKKTQDICISGLPPDADKKKIESLVSGILPADVKIVKVIVPRKKPTESTKEEIALIKKNISELFEEYTFKENIIVDIRRPSAKDVIWNAFVYFRNSLDGETAVNALKNRKNVSNFVGGFDLKPELKTFLCCKAEIFSVVKEEIEGALEFFKKDISPGSLLDIKADPKGTDTVEIKIRSNNVRDITDARRSIHMILRGDELKFPSDFQKAMLFSNAGKEMIRKLSVDFQECYILQNDFSKTISVFGKETFCNLIKMRINQYLSIAENEVFVELSLKTNSGKTGVLKQLFRKYGYDLEKLKEESAVSDIEVNTFKQLVAIRGSSQSIAKCESIIQEIKEILDVASDEMKGEKCPICQDEVSEDKHRLEYCGHAYCIECLLHLFKNSEGMPLNCGLCEDPIVLIDIFWAIEGRKQLQGVLFKKFLHYFVESRSDVSFCPSADCPMIFRVTKDVMNIFSCPSCGNNICTRCEDLFHPGMTCSLSKCLKSNVDASLEIWKNEDPNNRKQCPQCSSPIEKNGGCHHMTCWKCKCHMCWKCLKVFPTSSEVYEHLALCSGNSSLI